MIGYIYLTVNKINGKAYVGQKHAFPFTTKYVGSGLRLLKAIKKYGKNSFDVQLLEYCETQADLDKAEIYNIEAYRRLWGKELYNIAIGGEGGVMTGRKHSDRTIEKIRKKALGRVVDEETKKKIAETLKKKHESGYKTPLRKYPNKKEKVKKEYAIGYVRKCMCIETGEIYTSISDAEKKNKCKHIGEVIRNYGRVKTAGGYHWKYV